MFKWTSVYPPYDKRKTANPTSNKATPTNKESLSKVAIPIKEPRNIA